MRAIDRVLRPLRCKPQRAFRRQRNHTRLGAEIDCNDGLYDQGIAAMQKLLRNKKFVVPPRAPNEIDIDE